MLKRLSSRYQKEIALSFMAVFFISGLNTLKAELSNHGDFVYATTFNNSLSHKNGENNLTPDGKSMFPFGVSSFIDGDKGKKKKVSQGIAKLHNFSESNGKEKFSKPFIGGPSQPEMGAFKSVGSDNMVSPFTGDFSYNIPLLDVGGYPVNMFYSSGITMDQESSWLGLGWNINPGTITRNMRGLPDDFDGSDSITKKQSFRPDETWGVTTGADIKIAGIPSLGLGLGVSGGASYNNKLGIATEAGVHTSISLGAKAGNTKTANLSFSVGLNASSRGGASVTPSVGLSLQNQEGQTGGLTGSIGVGYTYSSRMGLSSMHLNANANLGVEMGEVTSSIGGNFNSTLSFAYPSIMPSISKRYTKASFSINTSVGLEYWWVNPTFKLGGYYTKTYLAEEDKITYHPAYGMLNYQKANGKDDAMLDFNRANDGIYTPASPAIAMPVYTYDVFSITGEGTGGSFRAYRGDIGHMRDTKVETKEEQGAVGLDLGFGNLFHGGASMSYVYTPTIVSDWTTNNGTGKTFSFQDNSGDYQASYFKNPGEKTVPDAAFQDKIANEDLVRLKLGNTGSATPIVLSNLIRYDAGKNRIGEKILASGIRKDVRDKRTQVISFLTADEAERIGASSKIYSYRTYNGYENKVILYNNCYKDGIDSFYRNHDAIHETTEPPIQPAYLGNEVTKFRHKNHISQIDVLGSDGRKYVYGLPVYNKKQVEVTFSIDPQLDKKSNSKVLYRPGSNTSENILGRDWILDQQEMPAYTHSYLLTALLSPNYVDLTGNGITEDDMGDGIKFNYSKYDDFKWRTPVGENTASYSEGLKTDDKDDKAHYIYGERESWYLYSVESKNMVARFYVKDREDGLAVLNENGKLDATNRMKKLYKISLFSKADLTKNPLTAKPIKTIIFFQSYKLCLSKPGPNDLGSNMITNSGKLTLDSIWITYNGNQRKPKSRYVFYYPDNTNNPDYGFDQTDRWGNYKPVSDNPSLGSNTYISNQDYPYSVQDKTKADKNAAAWTMNKILLPSGAVINIDYESDSYAYVQDKKAANMFQVLGFGRSGTILPNSVDLNKLYTDAGENDHVYIQLPYPINTGSEIDKKREFAARYLQDFDQFYLKLAVIMPTGEGLSGIQGTENIGVYADTAGYGLISPTVAWIKVGGIGVKHTPMVQAALQFLTQQLPGKAYKGYDGNAGGNATISALAGMIDAVKGLFNGEFKVLMGDKKCQQVELNKTYARLTNPTRNKFGGGLRVKRIVINDNWKKMTNQLKSTYGQEYNYTTTEMINNKQEIISSGVAAWEPSIGGDENPHRKIQRYVDHNKGGPYDFGAIEMPLGEMFYPGAMVGYSKVEVLSIHRDTVKNLPTRQVTEFYTNKEFPYKSTSTDLTGDAHVKYDV